MGLEYSMGRDIGRVQGQIELAKEIVDTAPSYLAEGPLSMMSNFEKADIERLLFLMVPITEFVNSLEGGERDRRSMGAIRQGS